MKKRNILAVFLLFFSQTIHAVNNSGGLNPPVGGAAILRQVALIEPIITLSGPDGNALYNRIVTTIEHLLFAKEDLTAACILHPTPEDKRYLEMVDATLFYIYSCAQRLLFMQDKKNYHDPNNPYNSTQQITQLQQQQTINQLISAIDQSNYAIDQLSRPKRMRYLKIGAYLLLGAAIIAGIGALFLGIYRGVYAIIKNPMETINDKQQRLVDEATEIANRIDKKVVGLHDDIKPVADNTREIKENIVQGLEILTDVTENTIPQMKEKIDDKIAIYQAMEKMQKRMEKIDELEAEVESLRSQQKTKNRIDQLQTKQLLKIKKQLKKQFRHMRTESQHFHNLCCDTCDGEKK